MASSENGNLRRWRNVSVAFGRLVHGPAEERVHRHLWEEDDHTAQPGPGFPGDSSGASQQGSWHGHYSDGNNINHYNPGVAQGSHGGSGSPAAASPEPPAGPNFQQNHSPPGQSMYGQQFGAEDGNNRPDSWPAAGTGSPQSFPAQGPRPGMPSQTYSVPASQYGGYRPENQSAQSFSGTSQSQSLYSTPHSGNQYATGPQANDFGGYGQQDVTAPTSNYWPQPPAASYQQYPSQGYDASGAGPRGFDGNM